VSEQILEEGHRFSFFQIVRLLQQLHPDAAPVGRQGPPNRECIRMRPLLGLGFAPGDVAEVTRSDAEDGWPRYEISTTFLGVYGTVSPLPSFYTEQLLDEAGPALARGLLDLFHHRLLSLFYRVWEKYSLVPSAQDRAGDVTLPRLLEIAGFDEKTAPVPEGSLDAWSLLAIAGLAAQQPRSAAALAAILRQAFPDLHADVEQCVGRWVEIPPAGRARLARANCRLGVDLSLGERVFTFHNTFRVVLGPVGAGAFLQILLPGTGFMERFREIVSLFNPDGLDAEIEVRIRPDAIPEARLGLESARLGWSLWIGRRPESNVSIRFLTRGWSHA
jgi:type VI secretion system protein ImpH